MEIDEPDAGLPCQFDAAAKHLDRPAPAVQRHERGMDGEDRVNLRQLPDEHAAVHPLEFLVDNQFKAVETGCPGHLEGLRQGEGEERS